MAKLGLRSHSGPFDWYYSDYWAVLKQMENDFSDFYDERKSENGGREKIL